MISNGIALSLIVPMAGAWVNPIPNNARNCGLTSRSVSGTRLAMGAANLHGQASCFLPLRQLDQEYYAPRIIQIAGAYPGITAEEFFAVKSEPSADDGQWSYDFSDPDGPQMGTVAIEVRAYLLYVYHF